MADRWIDVTSVKKIAAGITKKFNRKKFPLPQCGQGWSTAYVGNATVNGIKVIKIHQTSIHESDTYYIESGLTPYILRFTASGWQATSGDLVFGDYGVEPDTSAPPGAIPISEFE
jgi:hypothetical protein